METRSEFQIKPQPSAASLAALRRVLLKSRTNAGTTATENNRPNGSTNMRWSPFGVFTSQVKSIEEDPDPTRKEELYNVVTYRWLRSPFTEETKSEGKISEINDVIVTLRERREACGPSVNDIRVAQRDGVDNTGNFHWPTEDIMCRFLVDKWFKLEKCSAKGLCTSATDGIVLRLSEPVSFLELGSGCGLAAFVIAWCATRAGSATPMHVVATDGNSRVVETLKMNVELQYPSPSPTFITPILLPWQSPVHASTSFDLIASFDTEMCTRRKVLFGSDCLFFEDFHGHLANLIVSFHKRFSWSHHRPITLLMAPSRGGSFERFESLIKERLACVYPCDDISCKKDSENKCDCNATSSASVEKKSPPRCRRVESFDPYITALHSQLIETCNDKNSPRDASLEHVRSQYVPARHLPMLLVIE